MNDDFINNAPVLQLSGVVKNYKQGKQTLEVLAGVDLSIHSGEIIALVGQSGSGKSTLMNILGLLDVPTRGVYKLDGKNVAGLSDDELSDIRNKEIGFIFQGYNLIPSLTAKANVELPLVYRGMPAEQREQLWTK